MVRQCGNGGDIAAERQWDRVEEGGGTDSTIGGKRKWPKGRDKVQRMRVVEEDGGADGEAESVGRGRRRGADGRG